MTASLLRLYGEYPYIHICAMTPGTPYSRAVAQWIGEKPTHCWPVVGGIHFHILFPVNVWAAAAMLPETGWVRVKVHPQRMMTAVSLCYRSLDTMRYSPKAVARWYEKDPRPGRRPDDCVAMCLRVLAHVGVYLPRPIVTPGDVLNALAKHPRAAGQAAKPAD